jgi:signal transduction histidine kinase
MPISQSQRTYLLARGFGFLLLAAIAAALGELGLERFRLAAVLGFVITPASLIAEWRFPSERNPWTQPPGDAIAIGLCTWLAPATWHAAVAIGAVVIGKSSLRGSLSTPYVVLGVAGALLLGAGSSAWYYQLDGALPVTLGLLVAIPTVYYYAQREARRFEQDRSRAQRLDSLAQIAGGVGHDFNNLLMSIYGNAELVAAELPDEHPSQQASRRCSRACTARACSRRSSCRSREERCVNTRPSTSEPKPPSSRCCSKPSCRRVSEFRSRSNPSFRSSPGSAPSSSRC